MNDQPRNIVQKIWDSHVVADLGDGAVLLYIDRHLLNEVTSPQAFDGLRLAGRGVRRPDRTIAVADHNIPTEGRGRPIADEESRIQVNCLENNTAQFGIPYIPLSATAHGIVHVMGPEMGLTQPGMTIVCGDSHTSTHGAFGTLAFGIGTSEVEHVLATQTIVQSRPRVMLVRMTGQPSPGVTAKDMILAVIGRIGASGATGHVIEYAGEAIGALSMEGRMTICNMSIEAGARAGLIAPDDTTFAWLAGRPHAPGPADFAAAAARWQALRSDPGASYDRVVEVDAGAVAPMVTWGTSPEAVLPVDGRVPDPARETDPARAAQIRDMLAYMDIAPDTPLVGLPVDTVFIGSCTNGRVEDLRDAAAMLNGRKVADHVRALVVPGSQTVKQQAEAEGLDRLFMAAGFEWREAGCSMCLGMNADRLKPGERCASTSNRNFEGRQGPGGRTHLMSPAMAAAAAIHGAITDIRTIV
ncbi:3-isopropylmalate dehydratase large subunit [Qipengyuania sp. NPDC077410]|uniref:3-isopropylmalate dehydratase large subunit n=1 Tax=Qipengyuania sp. NPDC077410 TaxID=3364496 RepID=UPI0037CBEC1D